MVRPRHVDRGKVHNVVISLKLSPEERAQLSTLVEARAAELFALTGQHIAVTASGYIRWLLDREAAATKPARRSKPAKAKPTPKAKRSP